MNVEQRVEAGPPPAPPRQSPLRKRVIRWVRAALTAYNRTVARHSPLGDHVFFDPARFGWVNTLEAEWHAIRGELDRVLARPEPIPQFADVSPDQAHLTTYGKWKTFFLFAYGYDVPENCRLCPETTRLVKGIPGMQTAFFSILAPRMHIKPHCGPYGGVLRYHLALKVPEPPSACRIRVDQTVATWQEGRSLVFDDTYEHEAWNDSNAERVVLFVDFERPLPGALRIVNRLLIRAIALSPLVQNGRRRYAEWKRRVDGRPH